MSSYRSTLVVLAIVCVVLLIFLGPCRKRGEGLRGTIDSRGTSPTWISAMDDRIFVSNTASSTLDCFLTDTGEHIKRISDMKNVGFTLYSPETDRLFAAIGGIGAGTLLQIHPKTFKLEQQMDLDRECRGMAVSSDGEYIYAIWGGWKEGPGWITKSTVDNFDLVSGGSTRESPTAILLSPDGKKVYVASHYGQKNLAALLGEMEGAPELYSVVEVLDLTSGEEMRLVKEIRVGLKPQSMAHFANGRYIIVASTAFENEELGLPGLSIIDTETDEVIKEIYTPGMYPFMVVADDDLRMAFSTFLYKVPVAEDETAQAEIPSDEGAIDIEISRGGNETDSQSQESGNESGAGGGKIEYVGMYGRGFIAVDLEDFTVDIYEDPRQLPLASLCILPDKRIIGVSPMANRLVVIEPQLGGR